MVLATQAMVRQSAPGPTQTVLLIVGSVLTLLAIILAYQCNTGSGRILPIIGAIFFPEIYLIQWGVRKYILKSPGYCGNP